MDKIIDELATQAEELVCVIEQRKDYPQAIRSAHQIMRNINHAKTMLKTIRANVNVIPSTVNDGTIKLRFNNDPHPLTLDIFISAAQTIYCAVKPLLEDKP